MDASVFFRGIVPNSAQLHNQQQQQQLPTPCSMAQQFAEQEKLLSCKAADEPESLTQQVWREVTTMCRLSAEQEPDILGPYLERIVLRAGRLEVAVAQLLAEKLGCCGGMMSEAGLLGLFLSIVDAPQPAWPPLGELFAADILAVEERDPACKRCGGTALLFFKGLHALCLHRFAHVLLRFQNRRPLALALQSLGARHFAVDIHPAASIGRGVLLDHATGVVIGETAVLGDGCTLMHSVTLGGNGKDQGDRHPKVGRGVFVGAGAKIFGRVVVGDYAKIAGGSVVLRDVPPKSTAAGVPARIVGRPVDEQPANAMNNAIEGA